MCQPETLRDFLRFGAEQYPADRYLLLLWDHGEGTLGGFGRDELNGGKTLRLSEIRWALEESKVRPEAVIIDACLMGTLEMAYALRGLSDYLVAAEDVTPAAGLYYTTWLGALASSPSIATKTLCALIADTFLIRTPAQPLLQPTLSVVRLDRLEALYREVVSMVERRRLRMKKRILSVLLAMVMLLALVPPQALAYGSFDDEYIYRFRIYTRGESRMAGTRQVDLKMLDFSYGGWIEDGKGNNYERVYASIDRTKTDRSPTYYGDFATNCDRTIYLPLADPAPMRFGWNLMISDQYGYYNSFYVDDSPEDGVKSPGRGLFEMKSADPAQLNVTNVITRFNHGDRRGAGEPYYMINPDLLYKTMVTKNADLFKLNFALTILDGANPNAGKFTSAATTFYRRRVQFGTPTISGAAPAVQADTNYFNRANQEVTIELPIDSIHGLTSFSKSDSDALLNGFTAIANLYSGTDTTTALCDGPMVIYRDTINKKLVFTGSLKDGVTTGNNGLTLRLHNISMDIPGRGAYEYKGNSENTKVDVAGKTLSHYFSTHRVDRI